jgi:lipopolysaccharide/colanic/teichoic acid biosynthesis glycosyltransferase
MDLRPHGPEPRGRVPAGSTPPGRSRRPLPGDPAVATEAFRPIDVVRHADTMTRSAAHVRTELALGAAHLDVEPRERAEQFNRALNVVIATVALIILAPVMLLVAIAVRLTSTGPILYTQTRIGLDRRKSRVDALYDRRMQDLGGRVFTIYKFRTMYVDAEAVTGAVWATPRDPRLTPLGGIMRKLRLDELPQLYNVIRGDMNIVGPRPERPSIFARLRENITEYPLRQRIRPGITGWAQVNHSYDASLEDVRIKVRFDLEYLQRQCLAEDLKIMLKTVPVVLFRRGGW